MKETKFKDTEIGRIPEDWEVKMIGDICEGILQRTQQTLSPTNTTRNQTNHPF